MIVQHTKPNAELVLRDPQGMPLRGQLLRLSTRFRGILPIECRLTLEISPSEYERIDGQQLFHLSPDVRRQNALAAFSPNLPVQLDLILDPPLLDDLGDIEDAHEAAARLLQASRRRSHTSLTDTGSWYAAHVTQGVGPLRAGYSTQWAETKSAPRTTLTNADLL